LAYKFSPGWFKKIKTSSSSKSAQQKISHKSTQFLFESKRICNFFHKVKPLPLLFPPPHLWRGVHPEGIHPEGETGGEVKPVSGLVLKASPEGLNGCNSYGSG